jgi:DNA-binding response OmpR family regulator
VLAELDLPDLCGIALCQAVSEAPGLGSVPCVLRTSRPVDGATMRWAIEAGVSDFVPKTCPIDEVVDRADQLLRPSQVPRAFAFRCGAVDELRTARVHVSRAAA